MRLVGRGNGIGGLTWETQLRTSRLKIIFAWTLWNSFKLVYKLDRLVSHIQRSMDSSSISPTHRFILARDQAYFKAVFFSGDRPGDMGQVKVPEILHFPNNDGFLFNHV